MGLQEAREQLEASQSSAETSQTSSDVAPETTSGEQTQEQAEEIKELMELDSLQKFKFGGKEYTPDELKKNMMFQQDYTRKTQSLAQERQQIEQERKFAENLRYDVAAVMQNPSLISEFKRVYPKHYHGIVDELVRTSGQGGQPSLDPTLMALKDDVAGLKEYISKKDVEVHLAQIDTAFQKLTPKYDMADPDAVLLAAEKLLRETGQKAITDKEWEDMFKADHERHMGRYKAYYDKQFKDQQSASKKARDVPPGGGVPGQAPVNPKNLREARENAIASLTGKH